MDMSSAIQEAYAYSDKDISIFETLEIDHNSWGGSIKLVDSPYILTVTEGEFQPVTMDITIPEDQASVRGQMRITFNFLKKMYREMFYSAAQYANPVTVYYRQYIEGNSDPQAELPVALTVNSFEFTDNTTVINALYPDLVNIKICKLMQTAEILPGCQI